MPGQSWRFPVDGPALTAINEGGTVRLPLESVGRPDILFTATIPDPGPVGARAVEYMGVLSVEGQDASVEVKPAVMAVTFPKESLPRSIARTITRREPTAQGVVRVLAKMDAPEVDGPAFYSQYSRTY